MQYTKEKTEVKKTKWELKKYIWNCHAKLHYNEVVPSAKMVMFSLIFVKEM